MYKKVKAGKTKFALHKTTEEAKKLVTVGGLSEASAEGEANNYGYYWFPGNVNMAWGFYAV